MTNELEILKIECPYCHNTLSIAKPMVFDAMPSNEMPIPEILEDYDETN